MSLKPERKKLLDTLVASGVTIGDMHKKHGFNYKTVRKHHPKYRVGGNTHVNGKNQERIRESEHVIREMAKERAPGSAIAEVIGVEKQALRRHRPEVFWTPEEAAEFARMVQQVNKLNGFADKKKGE